MKQMSEKISLTLKTLRANLGWSLDVASKETGVSKAMLGQIERGESSPTIATLWKIATGFKTSFSSFIEEPVKKSKAVAHRKGSLKQMHPEDDKINVMPIFAYDPALRFEVFIIELLPGCEHLSPPHNQGVIENIVVSKGEMEVLIQGKWRTLKESDGLRFDASKPHGYRNLGKQRAVIQDIIHY